MTLDAGGPPRALSGRSRECAQIEALVDGARGGTSGVLVVRGEAGTGKTALLAHARAHAAGMTVLAAAGAQLESELAFASLADLLRPLLADLDDIPAPQAAALMAALALGPPVAGDRFTICAATLSLLGACADRRPVVALVDDAGLLDASSAEALLFAARRLGAEAVALIIAIRESDPSAFVDAGLPELVLGGLDAAAAQELLASAEGVDEIGGDVLDALLAATGGNPLALIELRDLIPSSQLSGVEALTLPLPAGSVEGVYRAEIARLPSDVRRALVLTSASDSAERGTIEAACAALDVGPDALDRAVAAGVLVPEATSVRFRHPLMREAVYRSASAAQRRAAHRVLAAQLGAPADATRRAWHLAASAPAPDEDVAAALEEAALGAGLRGAHAVAASAFERSARLTPTAEERARRLLMAASDRQIGGDLDAAVLLLDEALVLTRDELVAADIHRLRGRAEMWQGAPMSAHGLLMAEARRVEPSDPERAAQMLVEAAGACLMTWTLAEAERTARMAAATAARAGGEVALAAAALLGHALVLRREPGAEELLARAAPLVDGESAIRLSHLVPSLVLPLIWLERYERADWFLARAVDEARALSAPSALPQLLGYRSGLDYRTGRWASAYAAAGESTRLAIETGQVSESAHGLVCLIRVEAAMGRDAECAGHAERALDLADRFGIESVKLHTQSALARLDLARGRLEEAVVRLRDVAAAMDDHGVNEPSALLYEPDLIEALARSGRPAAAAEALDRFAGRATLAGPAAAAARCAGIIGSGAEEFERAIEAHERLPQPFERGRTELAYGEYLRRARRIADARPRLATALDVFTRLGAEPWAERARAELQASGATSAPSEDAFADLTAQELQVALKVAEGATNREVGAALFLSHKTVEAHLSRAFRKLGVRSRAELARVFASQEALAAWSAGAEVSGPGLAGRTLG